MLRTAALTSGGLFIALASRSNYYSATFCNEREAHKASNFDTQGFRYRFTPDIPVVPSAPTLYLAGVGNIVEKGVLQDTPIASVAIAFPPQTVKVAKRWLSLLFTENSNLAEYLLNTQSTLTKEKADTAALYFSPNPMKLSAMIRFTHNYSAREFVRLFEDSFEEVSQESANAFKESLLHAIGKRKIQCGDELAFYWFENGDLMMAKDNDIRAIVHIPEVNKPLLEAFVRKDRTISPTLADCVEKNISAIRLYGEASSKTKGE